MEMDDTLFFEQWHHYVKTFDEPSSLTFAPVLNIESSTERSDLSAMSRPLKQQKISNWDSRSKEAISLPPSSPSFIVFNNNYSFESKNQTLKPCQGTKRITTSNIGVCDTRPFSQAQEHILAERKRRERISERFISLSKLIPGLSKMDKATVLADAVQYIKQLQEKVKSLEEKADKIKPMQSVVFVKRYEVCKSHQNINSSSADISNDGSITTNDESVPEIEARVCDKDVLITIHCKKQKGVLEKLVAEIEKLHLTVVNTSVMSFGDCALNISVLAQMEEECNTNMNQLVKNIRVGALENLSKSVLVLPVTKAIVHTSGVDLHHFSNKVI